MKRFRFLFIPFIAAGFVAVATAGDPASSALAQEPGGSKLDKAKADIAAQIRALQDQLNALDAKKTVEKKIADPPKDGKKFKTGAKRTPLPKIIEAMRTGKLGVHKPRGPPNSLPASILRVPGTLSMLGNDQYGDCVTAESCFSMEAYSVGLGLPEIVITDAAAIAWASAQGVLNGADLLSVIQQMGAIGITASDGKLYKAGTPSTVDFSNEATLQSALSVGPVSLGIDSTALPSGAGNANGWSAFGGSPGQFSNEDHDVDVAGYGDAKTLFGALNTPVPAGAPSGTLYLLYTWSTIGVVDHAWIMSTAGEAYVRTPTVVGLNPPNPPTPQPITVAVADVTGQTGAAVTFLPLVSGGTGPYSFSYDYGDGTKDVTGAHTYSNAGTFTVTVVATDSLGATGTGMCKATIGTTPPIPPTPGGPSITLNQDLPAGSYYLLPQSVGNMRLIDVLGAKTPGPNLTPTEAQALREILDRLSKKGK